MEKSNRASGDSLLSEAKDGSSNSAVALALCSYLYLSCRAHVLGWWCSVCLLASLKDGETAAPSLSFFFFFSVFGATIKNKKK